MGSDMLEQFDRNDCCRFLLRPRSTTHPITRPAALPVSVGVTLLQLVLIKPSLKILLSPSLPKLEIETRRILSPDASSFVID
jgi:hypothetical protein